MWVKTCQDNSRCIPLDLAVLSRARQLWFWRFCSSKDGPQRSNLCLWEGNCLEKSHEHVSHDSHCSTTWYHLHQRSHQCTGELCQQLASSWQVLGSQGLHWSWISWVLKLKYQPQHYCIYTIVYYIQYTLYWHVLTIDNWATSIHSSSFKTLG